MEWTMDGISNAIAELVGDPPAPELDSTKTARLEQVKAITDEYIKRRRDFINAREILTLRASPTVLREGLRRYGVEFFLEMLWENKHVDPKDYARELVICMIMGPERLKVWARMLMEKIDPSLVPPLIIPFVQYVLTSKRHLMDYDTLQGLSMLSSYYDPVTLDMLRAVILESDDPETREMADWL